MICVGIDAAAYKHDVCIAHDTGVPFGKGFRIMNRREDYEMLLGRIEAAKKQFNDDKVRLGIESTGSYSETVVSFFSGIEGIEVVLINPLQTSMYQHYRKVHYAKTDRIDAEGIAQFIAVSRNIRTYVPPSYHIRRLRELFRECLSLNKDICECSNRLKSTIHRYFPEYLTVFSDIRCKASFYVLKKFPDPRVLTSRDPLKLMRHVNRHSGGLITQAKAEELTRLAGCTVGDLSHYNGTVIRSLVTRLEVCLRNKEDVLAEIGPIVSEEDPELLTVPGIGIISAAGIVGEIAGIDNFQNADQLTAYAGLDPKVYESGQYKAEGTRISKKGSSYLRNALYMASQGVIHFEPTFQAYYAKKLAEGKRYRVILGHVAKKLLRVIFRLMSRHENYQCQA